MEQQSLAESKTRIATHQQFPADLSSSPDVGLLPGRGGGGGLQDPPLNALNKRDEVIRSARRAKKNENCI